MLAQVFIILRARVSVRAFLSSYSRVEYCYGSVRLRPFRRGARWPAYALYAEPNEPGWTPSCCRWVVFLGKSLHPLHVVGLCSWESHFTLYMRASLHPVVRTCLTPAPICRQVHVVRVESARDRQPAAVLGPRLRHRGAAGHPQVGRRRRASGRLQEGQRKERQREGEGKRERARQRGNRTIPQ